jgi:malonate decarboxylase alpha subunit
MIYKEWETQAENRRARLLRASGVCRDRIVPAVSVTALLEELIEPGDRVCLEGNNQKQADFLAECLAQADPQRVYDLHMVQSVIAMPSHIELFERGIAARVDFCYSGPMGTRVAQLVADGKIRIGAIHTYLELFGRYFMDLTPKIALVAAQSADREGNLYTGPSTEDTPTIVEAAAFKDGIVIAQVNEIVDRLPRVDIPADWIDFVTEAPSPHVLEPLFTRDPVKIRESQILMAMMAIRGIYEEYGVDSLNHGVGYNTAAIELLLPTYGEHLGLKGKICRHWMLNPHPTLIPAIEAGFVKTVYSPGSELGMENYVSCRPDVFFTGRDGSQRTNRAFSHAAGHYACDLFIGSTLQMDIHGNSSTVTLGRITGFGGAPNLGADSPGRRHATSAWLKAGRQAREIGDGPARGRKLVVQITETFRKGGQPVFAEELDACQVMEKTGMILPPVMIYGDDISHVVTEKGIANLLLCRTSEERSEAIRGVAGDTPVGLGRCGRTVENLRDRGIIRRPDDLGVDISSATRDLLAARSIGDLVNCSGGLYEPPERFRTG